DFGLALGGDWSGSFTAFGNPSSKSPPQLSLGIRGKNFRYKQFDLSRYPIDIELQGHRNADKSVNLNQARATWGPNLQVTIRDCKASEKEIDVESIDITGDLNGLMALAPGDKVPSGWRKWVSPRGWRIQGDVEVGLKPDLIVRAPNTRVDLGGGQWGRLDVEFSKRTNRWRVSTVPMSLNLGPLLARLGVSRLESNGRLNIEAKASGTIPSANGGERSLQVLIKGGIVDSDGRLRKAAPPGKKGPYSLGWRDLDGSFAISIDNRSRSVSANFGFQNFGWYVAPSSNPRGKLTFTSVGGAGMRLRGEKDSLGRYVIHQLEFSLGDRNNIVIGASGLIDKQGEEWLPELNLKFQVNNSPPISAAPGVEVEGSGVLNATVRPERSGNWILEGSLKGEGLDVRVPKRPMDLENIEGVIPIEQVRLDEYIYKERWALREHPFPHVPLEPDVVDRAFDLPGSRSPNVTMDRVLVEDDDYRSFVGRMVMIDNIIYINSFTGLQAEGEFPLKGTGYLFIKPGKGAGMRIRGYSSKVPFNVAVPGLGDIGVDHDVVKIDWYNYQDPGEIKIETRHIYFDIPFGKVMKKIPAIGNFLFGWTPDSLDAYQLTIQRRKGEKYHVLHRGETGLVPVLPQFNKTDEHIAYPGEGEEGAWKKFTSKTRDLFGGDE
ncbi:MAG: hypothetical protein KC964_00950, partial [Candidatus Omnitrophica bacterium]|nr:hypothetical protein [Candidatus Omnitrophota bacterium]